MLIPSIDLMNGRIVQLVQGERLALESDAIDEWIDRFRGWPKVQLIDLDAAKNRGQNDELVARICTELPCRVGGGIRSVERASSVIAGGATHAIVGSALFKGGAIDTAFAEALATSIGPDRLIAAVDSKGGLVVIDAWRTSLPLTAATRCVSWSLSSAGFSIPTWTARGFCRAPTWRRSAEYARPLRATSSQQAESRRWRRLRSSIRWAWTQSSGWRCIRGG